MEQTIKTDNGELYVIGDKIVGRMETKGKVTKYYRGDKLHRDGDLPAYIRRNDAQCFAPQSINGVVTCEIYCRDGKKHRDGSLPAHIERNDAGGIKYKAYYCNGVKRSEAQVKEIAELVGKYAQEISAIKAELTAAHARNSKLQTQVDTLKQKNNAIKALVE